MLWVAINSRVEKLYFRSIIAFYKNAPECLRESRDAVKLTKENEKMQSGKVSSWIINCG